MNCPSIALEADAFNKVSLLLTEVKAMVDFLGHVAPVAEELHEQTIQTMCIIVENKVLEAHALMRQGKAVKVTAS